MLEIIKNVSVVRILVQISGSVMEKNCLVREAPSKFAHSYRLSGMADMDAIYITI